MKETKDFLLYGQRKINCGKFWLQEEKTVTETQYSIITTKRKKHEFSCYEKWILQRKNNRKIIIVAASEITVSSFGTETFSFTKKRPFTRSYKKLHSMIFLQHQAGISGFLVHLQEPHGISSWASPPLDMQYQETAREVNE